MKLRRLIFRDRIPLTIEYANLVKSFTNSNEFIKGQIKGQRTTMFYRSRLFGLPLTKVNVENDMNDKGELIINFKMVDSIPLIFGLSSLLVWRDFMLDVDGFRQQGGLFAPILVTLFFYGYLQFGYYMELLDVKVDLKQIESEWRKSIVR